MRRVTGWAAVNVQAKLKWIVAGGAIAVTTIAAACSSNTQPGYLDPNNNPNPPGSCATPGEGCTCPTAGAVVDCGQVISRQGDYVTCSAGKRTCDGSKWGACKGDHVLYRSVGPVGDLQPLGLGGQTACTDNPCDPNCQIITDDGTGLDAGPTFQPTGDGGLTLSLGEGGTACVGLQCQIVSCGGGITTDLTGTVYDPAGVNPIYNAYVYIPATTPLPAIPKGAQPDPCGGGGNLPPAVSYALTGPDGKFTLKNVPVGNNIPIVVQAGKWRRMTNITVPQCVTTAVPAANTRLPRNQTEGNMPHIGIVAGACDPMECLLTRIGIDTTEFQDPGAGGAVDYYRGPGAAPLLGGANPNPSALLGAVKTLANYDLVMMPCDCGYEYGGGNSWWNAWYGINKSHHDNLVSYANAGGRIFASHYGREWIEAAHLDGGYVEPFPNVATWGNDGAIWGPWAQFGTVNQGFQRGKDFASWLQIVNATSTLGQLWINPTRYDAYSVTPANSQLWVGYNANPQGPADFTFNTPLGAAPANQFGRVMYTDMHLAVANGGSAYFPGECDKSPLIAQEDAAEFLLMDLGSCLSALPPPAPPTYTASTFTRTFTASCPVGKYVAWRTFYWKDMTPGDSNIVFAAQTGDTVNTLLPQVALATASGAPNFTFVGAAVDVALKGAGQVSHPVLQVKMTLNPTSDKLQAPTLLGWQQTFDCVDSL